MKESWGNNNFDQIISRLRPGNGAFKKARAESQEVAHMKRASPFLSWIWGERAFSQKKEKGEENMLNSIQAIQLCVKKTASKYISAVNSNKDLPLYTTKITFFGKGNFWSIREKKRDMMS